MSKRTFPLLAVLVGSLFLAPLSRAQSRILLSPTSISLSATTGGTASSASLAVTSSSQTRITVSVSGTSRGTTWLSVSPSGRLTTPQTLTVVANPAGLAAATYSGVININSNETNHRVPVTFTVSVPKTLTVTPTSLSFSSVYKGTAAGPQGIGISATPNTSFTVAKSGGSWLSVSALSGTTPASISVASNASGLNAGSYSASVAITGNGITRTVPVGFTINKATQAITFSPSTPITAKSLPLNDSLSATGGGSGNPVTFTLASGPATISGSSLIISGAGTISVCANQAGSTNYLAAPQVCRSIVVSSTSKISQTINFTPLTSPVTYSSGLTVPLTATASSGLPVTLSLDPSTTGSGSISGSSLMVVGTGSFVIDANQSGNTTYASAPQVQRTLVVNPAASLTLNPTSLGFSGTVAGAQPATQSIAISSSSTTTFTATVTGAPWLSVSPASGSLPATLTVSASVTGLAAGSFSGSINITTASGLSGSVPVSLALTGSSAGLTVSPMSLSFDALAGETAQALESIDVSAASATPFTVTTSGLTWLSASPSSGTTPATITLTANVSGIAAGNYTGSVVVTSASSTVTVPVAVTVTASTAGPFKVVSWNDLGMHCFDGKDYSVFGVLPPYNTIHAHLIDTSGSLVVDSSSYTIEYAAIPDPATGAISSTSAPKTNFWDYSSYMSLGSPAPDVGIAGSAMPGTANKPQPMKFSAADNTWVATGIPEMPYADNGTTNYFPMMRVTARNSSGAVVATTDVVLPTSDEMTCRTCHASNSNPNAMPKAGWVNNPDPAVDTKLNILRKHDDDQQPTSLYQSAATQLGFATSGLEATVRTRPVLCAQCHASNALGMIGVTGIEALTTAMHSRHAAVVDPATNATMDSSTVRSTCYSCHPGPKTQCLRGAMGNLKTATGANAIECQSCHGNLTALANTSRSGWLNEPTCQSCHTGLASSTNTTLAYTSVFSSGTTMRTPADTTFATNLNAPATGLSLYRYSSGHGGLQCEACHGSTHAIFPTSIANDNVQSTNLQGHSGVLVECSTCHKTVPTTTNGGPHGIHPVGATWVSRHPDVADKGTTACQGCHGTDYRGTILSRVQTTRTLAGKTFTAGTIIGCYSCHNGPNGD